MTRFIALVSGKGGVGKTTTAIGLGQAFTKAGRKVIVLDANLVTPNVALHLGIMNPIVTLNTFLRKQHNIQEITYLHQSGLAFIPASPSYTEFQKTNAQHLPEVFEHLDETVDVVLVDAPSGLGYEVTQVLKNTDECLVIVTPTLSSVVDALKTIELAKAHNNIISGIVVNMSHKGRHEIQPDEIEEIVGHHIIGNVRFDRKVRKALHKQAPINYLYPWSRTSRELQKIVTFLSLES